MIREEGYLYVDKTKYIADFRKKGMKYIFLSRPRRFGKSLFASTLQAYFEGRKELFEGLAIADYEKDWVKHPVLHFDMSGAKHFDGERLERYLADMLEEKEIIWGYKSHQEDANLRLKDLVKKACEQTGEKVVVIIDEYDAPLLDVVHEKDNLSQLRRIMQNFYSPLKMLDPYLEFCFITGITKFSQLSIFSELNNLDNISMLDQYSAICGISKDELVTSLKPDVEALGESLGVSYEECLDELRQYYDGYHFSDENMTDIYNPFSLLNALSQLRLRNYWISSGATSMLNKFVNNMELRLHDFEDCYIDKDTLETSDVIEGGAELFLYQTGYLTIKGFDEDGYSLGFPNEEVRKALYKAVLPALTQKDITDIVSIQSRLMHSMNNGNLEEAKQCMKSLISNVPYSNKKLVSMDMEERYRLIISTILNAIGCQVEVEHMLSTGRIDIVASTSRFIYVMELKLANNGGINAAEKQMIDNGYLKPFLADGRKVIGVAVELDDMGKGLIDWKEVK